MSTANAPAAPSNRSTAFTYQGLLKSAGQPVNSTADLQFALFDDPTASTNQIGATVSLNAYPIDNGLITAELDFGSNAFDGASRWLEVAVRVPAGSGSFTTLAPRQSITPVPYAMHALSGGEIGPPGPAGPAGPAGVTGQLAATAYGTAQLNVGASMITFTLLPGLTQTIQVPENATVVIFADGGAQCTVTGSASGHSAVDIALFIDDLVSENAGYKRVVAANTNGITSNMIANWHLARSLTLTPGQHTIQIRARYVSGGTAIVSGNSTSVIQAQLTVMIIKH